MFDIYKGIEKKVAKLHQQAAKYKDGKRVKIGKEYYIFSFDTYMGVFVVTKEGDKNSEVRYNTRKITDAKKWFIADYI